MWRFLIYLGISPLGLLAVSFHEDASVEYLTPCFDFGSYFIKLQFSVLLHIVAGRNSV